MTASRTNGPRSLGDSLGQLERLGKLRATGVLTDEEFAAKKAQILASRSEETERAIAEKSSSEIAAVPPAAEWKQSGCAWLAGIGCGGFLFLSLIGGFGGSIEEPSRPGQTATVLDTDPESEESTRLGSSSEPSLPAVPSRSPSVVLCNRFDLQWELERDALILSIDTDLPDYGELSVSVSRTYYQVGEAEAYAEDYLTLSEPVARWREQRRVSLDADAWRAKLLAEQERLAGILPFEVARVSDDVEIRAVLHMNQTDERFGGRGNPNLSGSAVSAYSPGRNLVEAEATFRLPLAGGMEPPPPPPRCPDGAARALRGGAYLYESMPVGCTYTADGVLPVVVAPTPELAAGREFEWVERLLSLPAGTRFHIVGRRQEELVNWYEVRLPDYEDVAGWINPTAVINRRLRAQ